MSVPRKVAVLFILSDRVVIRSGQQGKGREIVRKNLTQHICDTGCRCEEIRAPIIISLVRRAGREGFAVFNEAGEQLHMDA